MDPVNESTIFEARVFGFDFFHDLFAERTHFRRTGNGHIFVAFIPAKQGKTVLIKSIKCKQR